MTSNRNAATRRARAAKVLALLCTLITIVSTLSIFAIPVGAEETEVTSDIVFNIPVLECTELYCHTYTETGWHSVSADALVNYQPLGEISAYSESGLTFWLLLDDTCIADANVCFYFDQNGVKSDAVKIDLSKTHTFNDGRSLYYVSLSVSRLEKISYGYPLYFDFRHNVTQNTASSYYVQAGVCYTSVFEEEVGNGIGISNSACFDALAEHPAFGSQYIQTYVSGYFPPSENKNVLSITQLSNGKSALPLDDYSYDSLASTRSGVVIWFLTDVPHHDVAVHLMFNKHGYTPQSSGYPRVYLDRVCTFSDGYTLYAAFFTGEEWSTMIDDLYSPTRYSLYMSILSSSDNYYNVKTGISFTSDFVAHTSSNIFRSLREEEYIYGYIDGVEDTAADNNVIWQNGFDDGYADGKADGYANGKADGYTEGLEEGIDRGTNSGYADGYREGKEDGIKKGYADCLDENEAVQGGYVKGFIEGAFSTFKQAWETISSLDLGIGLTIGGIVGTAILAVVVIFIVKMVKK